MPSEVRSGNVSFEKSYVPEIWRVYYLGKFVGLIEFGSLSFNVNSSLSDSEMDEITKTAVRISLIDGNST